MPLTHRQLRAIEALSALMLATLLVAVVFLTAGCAAVTEIREQKALIMAPASLNSTSSKHSIELSYATSVKAAQHDPTAIATMIDAGNAVNALHCSDWLGRISAGKRNAMFSDHQMGVGSALAQTLMGIAKVSSGVVAVTGALEVAAQGVMENVQTDLLTAPSSYQVQTTLLSMLDSCASQVWSDAQALSWAQAYIRLEACSHVCSFDAAQAATTNALMQTLTTVHPVSGAIRSMPRERQ